MRELTVRLERRYDAAPERLWDLVVDPRVSLRFQSKARLECMTGEPGTVGFTYSMATARGRRIDTVEVVEAEAPRLLRERVTSDFFAASAPGEVVHPSEQLTDLAPDGSGTLLRWQLTTLAPRWAGPYTRWATRRTVNAILDGLTTEIASRRSP